MRIEERSVRTLSAAAIAAALILGPDPASTRAQTPAPSESESLRKTVALAREHLDRFWTEQLGVYRPPVRVEAYTPGTPGPCFASRPKGNAYHCMERLQRGIYYDPAFFEELLHDHGQYAPVLVLAHEWGHHVQSFIEQPYMFSLQDELQADCLAGAFTRYAADRDVFGPTLTQDSARTMLTLGDTLPWFHAGAHGRRGQRLDAFDHGFSRQACLADTFFSALGIDIDTLEQLPVAAGQSLKDFVEGTVGDYTRGSIRHVRTTLSVGAIQGITSRYRDRAGVEVAYDLTAFASEQDAAAFLDAFVDDLRTAGFKESRRATVADPNQRPLGTLVGMQASREVIVWTNQRMFGSVEGPPGSAWAFARLVTMPGDD